jgi:hypothetical protein
VIKRNLNALRRIVSAARCDDRHRGMIKARLASTHRIDVDPSEQVELNMTKLYALIAASMVFTPFALAAMHQAAQMVA